MKKFLFVVPPLTGHVNPTVSVARVLAARGHRVAWVSYARQVRHLLPEGAELFALDESQEVRSGWTQIANDAKGVRGLESFQFLWERVLIPLAESMIAGVSKAISSYEPDVVVADQQAIAGAFVARKENRTWATFCTTSAGVVDALADLPKVKSWVDQKLNELEARVGLLHDDTRDSSGPQMSKKLVVVFSSEEFVGAANSFPASYKFVGPAIIDRDDLTPFPWEKLEQKKRVFISLGTVSAESGAPFYDACVKGLAALDAQIILAAPSALVPNPPPSFLVRDRVPQLLLLPKVDAVVCHAGHNTVCEALANGLPLVVAPIRDDQPVVAEQVVRAGAGLRVRYGRLTPKALREAVVRVLEEPIFRESAARVRDSFSRAGGANAAADALLSLASEAS